MKLFNEILHGRMLSVSFFRRNWLWVLAIVVMLIIYITGRYQCQTQMEEIHRLTTELEITQTERVRAKSTYMSLIRESSMQHRVDSLGLHLGVQDHPPFTLDLD